MREIDSFFQRAAPAPLFHYSGIGALIGMASTRTVWASNAYYLNDSREVVHACEILDEELLPRLVFGNQVSSEVDFLKQLKKWVDEFRRTHYNIFIFSLSQEMSLLSQWRSYTPHGKGVSIGFSPTTLQLMAQSSGAVLAECIYQRQEQGEIIRSLIEKILITFRQREASIDVTNEPVDQRYFSFLEEFRGDFLRVLCVIKHPSFAEEREWRLISPYFPRYTAPTIKFREGASMLVPYVEFPLPTIGPIFDSVILGPSQHQQLSMSALSMYLSNQGICNTTINCVIPYREW